jgi:hypothetical protein
MSVTANVKLITTRANTNTDFWWTTTDSSVASLRNAALAIADQMGIAHETTVSPNQLTCSVTYSVTSEQQWQDFAAAVTSSLPTLSGIRNSYHTNAGHNLKLEARLTESNELVKDINIV